MLNIMLKNALGDLGLSGEDVSKEMENFEMEQSKNDYICLDSDDCNCPECAMELLARIVGEFRAMFGDNLPDSFDLMYSRVEHYGRTHIVNFDLDRFTAQVNLADVNYKVRNGLA